MLARLSGLWRRTGGRALREVEAQIAFRRWYNHTFTCDHCRRTGLPGCDEEQRLFNLTAEPSGRETIGDERIT